MNTATKRSAALKLLATTGIRESNFAPPGVKLIWLLGVDCPPPHMARFSGTALVAGLYFAGAWGLFMSLFVWAQGTISVTEAFIASIAAGIFFGLSMASYYAIGRRKHNLPLWKDFTPSR